MTTTRRAQCPTCDRPNVSVNRDGTFRVHRYVMDSPHFAYCPGSGVVPPPETVEADRDPDHTT